MEVKYHHDINRWDALEKSLYHCVSGHYYVNGGLYNDKDLVVTINNVDYFCPKSQWSFMERIALPVYIFPTEKVMVQNQKFMTWQVNYFASIRAIVQEELSNMKVLLQHCQSCQKPLSSCDYKTDCLSSFFLTEEENFKKKVCSLERFMYLPCNELYGIYRELLTDRNVKKKRKHSD